MIASDAVWNAIPGNLADPVQVLAGSHPPTYRPKPDYDPPAAIDKAATAVELSAWKMEMGMHFAYTRAQNTLSDALLASVRPVNKTLLKVEFHPTPLHFLTPRQIVDCMFKTHASITGPDLKKLRAPLSEHLKAVAELELHMSQFMFATIKLSATGHGDDTYRSFEQFLETNAGFPLIKATLTGYYTLYPTVDRQTITTLFAYLKPMVTHLIDQTGSAPLSGGAATPTPRGPKSNPNCTKKRGLKRRTQAQWGSWENAPTPGHFAGSGFQAQTPPTFLGSEREAECMAEIQRLQTMLATSSNLQQQVFSMQQHAYATQNAPSAYRPRSHYCGLLHGWNNDPKFTMDMRNATTHVGTGGNPNVGVPVGFVRPPHFSWSPPLSLSTSLPCSRADTCLSPPSLGSSVKHCANPNEDTCARTSPASLLRPKSEGIKSALVRESEAAFVSPQVSSLPACPLSCLSPMSSVDIKVS